MKPGGYKFCVEEPCSGVCASELESLIEVHVLLTNAFAHKSPKAGIQAQKVCSSTIVFGQKLGVKHWCSCVSDAEV